MLLNGFILYFVAVHAAILSEPRFHLPLIAILAVYAAYGYSRLAAWSKENAQAGKRPWPGGLPRGLAILAITLSLLLLANWGYQFWSEADRWAVVLAPGGYTGRFNY